MSITLQIEKSRIYFEGNTFPIKDQIKNLGGHWDGDARKWWVGKTKQADAERLVSGAAQQTAQAPTEGAPDSQEVLGRADYKGKSYLVIAVSKDGARFLLAFTDGSKKWWADAALVTWTKRYNGERPVTIGSLKRFVERIKADEQAKASGTAETRRCWECGRDFSYMDAKRNDGDWQDGYCGC